MNKSKWGDGPWLTEPDHLEFKHSGLSCYLHRMEMGHWCGYVAVPAGHPMHGMDYNHVNANVHGGLTYGRGEPPLWWFGFDCAHHNDYLPGIPYGGEYWTVEMVKEETMQLADQLSAMKGEK